MRHGSRYSKLQTNDPVHLGASGTLGRQARAPHDLEARPLFTLLHRSSEAFLVVPVEIYKELMHNKLDTPPDLQSMPLFTPTMISHWHCGNIYVLQSWWDTQERPRLPTAEGAQNDLGLVHL